MPTDATHDDFACRVIIWTEFTAGVIELKDTCSKNHLNSDLIYELTLQLASAYTELDEADLRALLSGIHSLYERNGLEYPQ